MPVNHTYHVIYLFTSHVFNVNKHSKLKVVSGLDHYLLMNYFCFTVKLSHYFCFV